MMRRPTISTRIALTPRTHTNLIAPGLAGIETSAAGWTGAVNCSVARSTLFASDGVASLEMTITALGYGRAETPGGLSGIPVRGGNLYTVRCDAKEAVANTRSFRAGVSWYTAAGAFISEDESALMSLSTTFATASLTVVAPATAAFAQPYDIVSSAGGTTTGEKYYFDKHGFYFGSSSAWSI